MGIVRRGSWWTSYVMLSIGVIVVATVACRSGSNTRRPAATTPVADGESIGKIERSAGGTAVVTDVRTLLTLSCGNGELTIRTNLDALAGGMDCSRMVGQSVTDRFLGQPVVITYAGGAVQIENPTAGTIVLPNIANLTRMKTDASP
jgi:hypothetical protein